jgi:hypothetical protein
MTLSTNRRRSERFDEVWSTPAGQALALEGRLAIIRTFECAGPEHRPAARVERIRARAHARYLRRKEAAQ